MAGNKRIAFRAPEALRSEVEARQDALSAALDSSGDAPLGSTARRDLERYYAVIRDELKRLQLTQREVLLILDAMNGVIVDPAEMYRSTILLDVADHIRLNAADEKWDIDGDGLIRKLEALSPGTLMALVDLAERFWARSEEAADAVLKDLGVRAWLAGGGQ